MSRCVPAYPLLLRSDFLAEPEELPQADCRSHGHIRRQGLDMLSEAVVEHPIVARDLSITQVYVPGFHDWMEQSEWDKTAAKDIVNHLFRVEVGAQRSFEVGNVALQL